MMVTLRSTLIVVGIFSTCLLHSQQHFEGVNWGFKLGFSVNSFTNSVGPWDDPLFLSQTGNSSKYEGSGNFSLQAGGFVGYDYNDYFSVQADLQFTGKGARYVRNNNQVSMYYENGSSYSETDYIQYQLRYIELPLAVRVTPFTRISVKLGLVPGFNVYSKVKYNYWVADKDQKNVDWLPGEDLVNVKEETEKVDFEYASDVILSGVIELHYNTRHGFIYLSYNQSLTNIFSVPEINGYNYQTTDAYIALGYAFRILAY